MKKKLNEFLTSATCFLPLAFVIACNVDRLSIKRPVELFLSFAGAAIIAFFLYIIGYVVAHEGTSEDVTRNIDSSLSTRNRLLRFAGLLLVCFAICLHYGFISTELPEEKMYCAVCSQEVSQYINTIYDTEVVCVDCFNQKEYFICLDCEKAYKDWEQGYMGYCIKYLEDHPAAECYQCGDILFQENMIDLGEEDGREKFLCPGCTSMILEDEDGFFREEYGYTPIDDLRDWFLD